MKGIVQNRNQNVRLILMSYAANVTRNLFIYLRSNAPTELNYKNCWFPWGRTVKLELETDEP